LKLLLRCGSGLRSSVVWQCIAGYFFRRFEGTYFTYPIRILIFYAKMISRSIYNLKIDTICMCDIPFDRSILQLSRHVVPYTDRKLELTTKASMAQPVSQPAVCSNGLIRKTLEVGRRPVTESLAPIVQWRDVISQKNRTRNKELPVLKVYWFYLLPSSVRSRDSILYEIRNEKITCPSLPLPTDLCFYISPVDITFLIEWNITNTNGTGNEVQTCYLCLINLGNPCMKTMLLCLSCCWQGRQIFCNSGT
jgi:hypothetical protein